MEGTVRKWVTSYGFISAGGDKDFFVHQSEVPNGQPLADEKGPKAVKVELVDEE